MMKNAEDSSPQCQRMGESVIHEARQKAETIIYDATSKASRAREKKPWKR